MATVDSAEPAEPAEPAGPDPGPAAPHARFPTPRPGDAAALFIAVTPYEPPSGATPSAPENRAGDLRGDRALPTGERPDRVTVDLAAAAGDGDGALPRRRPSAPAGPPPGGRGIGRAPVLDRIWARDMHTLHRLLVGLRAL